MIRVVNNLVFIYLLDSNNVNPRRNSDVLLGMTKNVTLLYRTKVEAIVTYANIHGTTRIAIVKWYPFEQKATTAKLFWEEYNRKRYEEVLDDCCLRPDLK